MGNDQSNWSAPCGRTCSSITIWGHQNRNNNPPPDINNDQRQSRIRQSQLYELAEETQVFSAPAFPSTVSQIQISVICGQELGGHKVQDQQQSCELHGSRCSVKC
jgi:hypothetical protein